MLSNQADSENVLYSFVVAGSIVYIGKSTQALRRRMYGCQSPGPTQSTNIKANKLILEALKASESVDVYVLPDNGLLYYGGFHVNLAAGLKDSLVRTLKPIWNKVGI